MRIIRVRAAGTERRHDVTGGRARIALGLNHRRDSIPAGVGLLILVSWNGKGHFARRGGHLHVPTRSITFLRPLLRLHAWLQVWRVQLVLAAATPTAIAEAANETRNRRVGVINIKRGLVVHASIILSRVATGPRLAASLTPLLLLLLLLLRLECISIKAVWCHGTIQRRLEVCCVGLLIARGGGTGAVGVAAVPNHRISAIEHVRLRIVRVICESCVTTRRVVLALLHIHGEVVVAVATPNKQKKGKEMFPVMFWFKYEDVSEEQMNHIHTYTHTDTAHADTRTHTQTHTQTHAHTRRHTRRHAQVDDVVKSLHNPIVTTSHLALATALSAVRNISNDVDEVKKMISTDVLEVMIRCSRRS